jgi:outer membrane receptor for ferrienterochelin and colicins
MPRFWQASARAWFGIGGALFLLLAPTRASQAQTTGEVRGTITRADDQSPIQGVTVNLKGTSVQAVSDRQGRYRLMGVPTGRQVLVARWIGFRATESEVDVPAGGTATLDLSLQAVPVPLSDIIVTTASREPERVVEAPAAIIIVDPVVARSLSATGQVPLALAGMPGVDVTQSGITDFNVNTRGFNSSLSRRVLVLQDGRDLAIPFLGSQEWSALSMPLEDLGRLEMIRGPGSALYGANAYSGVLNITTPTARETPGTKLSLAGGELSTLRADFRNASVFGDGRFGYRFNVGYYQSDTWTRSRTNIGDLAGEYAEAVDTSEAPVNTPAPGFELRPLAGQTKQGPFGTPGAVTGDRDDIQSIYGAVRLDNYRPNGSVISLEGGDARVENEVLVTGIGRVQVGQSVRPWVRAAWAADRFHLMFWYGARKGLESSHSLASGIPIEDESHSIHGEAQTNWRMFSDRARIVVGASARNTSMNTKGSLVDPIDDDRSDAYYSIFTQTEYELTPQVRVITAFRFDDGDLFEGQWSPKGALVYSPNERNSVRLTVNRAFQTPSALEFFLRVAAGAPANLYPLEQGLRASPLGPALAGVPDSQLFTRSNSVPVLAMGNKNLDVEHVTSFELGYKGQLSSRIYVTIDGYYNKLTDFVTDLLPGINPDFGAWEAPPQVPAQFRPALEDAVRQQLIAAGQTTAAFGLTRIGDLDSTAIVVSYGNAGEAEEYGIELGAGLQVTDEIQLQGNYTLFDFEVDTTTVATGDRLVPNTPEHKLNLAASYRGDNGIDLRVAARFVSSYDWAAGTFVGTIPSSETVDVSAGYQVNGWLRVHAVATNVFDQQRYQVYGGSVIGRRMIAGVTATF